MMNLTTLLGNEAQKSIAIKIKKRKHLYKYNWVNAYKFIKFSFVELFTSPNIQDVIAKIIAQIERSIIGIISDRKFVRQTKSIKKHRFSPMYK